MKKQEIVKRLKRIHELVCNSNTDYSKETEYILDEKDREIDRLLRRIEHICKVNNEKY